MRKANNLPLLEGFKFIPGYEGLYAINNDGIIISFYGKITRKLSPNKNNRGYLTVQLCKNGLPTRFLIHRLLALSFLGPSDLEVNHKDGNKENNNITNIEYCTRGENVRHSFNTGLQQGINKGKYGFDNHKSQSVVFMSNGKIYGSIREASRMSGFHYKKIIGNIISRDTTPYLVGL